MYRPLKIFWRWSLRHTVIAAKIVYKDGMTLAEVCEGVVKNFVKMHCDDRNSADTSKLLCTSKTLIYWPRLRKV